VRIRRVLEVLLVERRLLVQGELGGLLLGLLERLLKGERLLKLGVLLVWIWEFLSLVFKLELLLRLLLDVMVLLTEVFVVEVLRLLSLEVEVWVLRLEVQRLLMNLVPTVILILGLNVEVHVLIHSLIIVERVLISRDFNL
jgi:hypothetical protein